MVEAWHHHKFSWRGRRAGHGSAPRAADPEAAFKLYDKKAAPDAIARHLGMFERMPQRPEDGEPLDDVEDPRDVIARRLARLAAGGAEE